MTGSPTRLLAALFAATSLAASVRADDLESRILPLAKAHKGVVAVAVKNLKTGEEFYLNADEPLPTASLIKLPVMVEAYQQAADGKLKLDQMVTVPKKKDQAPGSGILMYHFSDGATFQLRDAIRLMIRYSDNTATNMVVDAIGLPSTAARMEALGLTETKLHSKVFKRETSIAMERSKKYGLGSTTAREMVTLLGMIDAGKVVSPEACKEMIAHLKTCDAPTRFPRYLPGTPVAFKTGSVDAVRTAAGIIYPKGGDPIALCVLTNNNEDQRWTADNAGEVLEAKLAKAVVDYFQAKAPAKAPTKAAAGFDPKTLDRIDAAVEATIQAGGCPGAVVAVVHGDRVVYRKAFGQRAKVPAAVPMTADTVFDMASLTKPIATATSVHVLIERGKIKLSDPVAKFWPEFAANDKGGVTVEHCLLHTTGLTADNSINDYAEGRAKAMEKVAALRLEAPVGTRFRYSDVGFIVLGELVGRVSGKPVDEFARENVFGPLKMADTRYKPGEAQTTRVAPTGKRDGSVILGEVHDPRAYKMGGVAGHAGLFSTADDVARYCRMLLNGGELDGVRVLSKESVERFTAPVEVPNGRPTGDKDRDRDARPPRKLLRSRGWDVDTSFSSPRGTAFAPGTGYGHTGFTGTSVWVDPASKTAVIVLTNRVHPDDKGNVTDLRKQVGTIVADAVTAK